MGRRAVIKAKRRNRRVITVSLLASAMVAILVLVVIVEASMRVPGDQYSASIGQQVSPSVMQDVDGVSNSTLSAIGAPASVTPPVAISGSPLSLDGKPEVLYIGGEFCPFCAVERWSLIVALSHFGTFDALNYMQSSRTDVNPNTPTFTFANSTYTSRYITFVAVEEFNRAEQTATTLSGDEPSLYSQYGMCPSTGQAGIPFIDIGNSYVVNCGAQFALPQIAGDNWTQVSTQLNDPGSPIAMEVDGAANTLIAAMCKVDGGQPASVCGQSFANIVSEHTIAPGSPSGLEQNVLVSPRMRDDSY